ncbi:MAG TPA: hypothetical protein VL287_19030 [Gemmatimonadales bacterium]|jgi:hypothetical protein|nr:hypothetical protein [Gemmatimonadales bacterium]
MDRRAFIAAVTGGLLAAPLAVEAQPAGKVYRIGWLGTVQVPANAPGREAFNGLLDRETAG